MINWLGQELHPGDFVYRGAREGNGSEFRLGDVVSVDEVKNKVQVLWEYSYNYETPTITRTLSWCDPAGVILADQSVTSHIEAQIRVRDVKIWDDHRATRGPDSCYTTQIQDKYGWHNKYCSSCEELLSL